MLSELELVQSSEFPKQHRCTVTYEEISDLAAR